VDLQQQLLYCVHLLRQLKQLLYCLRLLQHQL
jgi:hypothetical protein